MKKSFLIFFPLLLSACTTAKITIRPEEIYQGYPCLDHCPAFQKGYDTAQKYQFNNDLQCASLPLDEASGCQAFLTESHRARPDFTDLRLKLQTSFQ